MGNSCNFKPCVLYVIYVPIPFWLSFTSRQRYKRSKANFQLYWWRKTSARTKDVPQASWIASSHEIFQSPWEDWNPQW